jgi:hypothetical protein
VAEQVYMAPLNMRVIILRIKAAGAVDNKVGVLLQGSTHRLLISVPL